MHLNTAHAAGFVQTDFYFSIIRHLYFSMKNILEIKSMNELRKHRIYSNSWTQNDEETLISLHSLMTYAEIGNILGKSESKIRKKAAYLREAGKLPCKRKPFSPEQDKFIRKNCRIMTIKEVARTLKRPVSSIVNRARLLGISYFKCGDLYYKTKYPDSDVYLIRELRDSGLSFSEIAKKFEICPNSVQYLYHSRLTADYAIRREMLP
ncbi:AsnC family protein [Salmonella enterica subsp. enterica serovar Grumpensis]|nr:AsnC family protein [Salmonella enterica subsp. enterica serovar Grumpensis]